MITPPPVDTGFLLNGQTCIHQTRIIPYSATPTPAPISMHTLVDVHTAWMLDTFTAGNLLTLSIHVSPHPAPPNPTFILCGSFLWIAGQLHEFVTLLISYYVIKQHWAHNVHNVYNDCKTRGKGKVLSI